MTTRRDLLTGAAAIVAVPLLPIAASAATSADAALFALVERRQFYRAACDNDEDEARIGALGDRIQELEDEMAERPAATIAGIVVKLRIAFGVMLPNEAVYELRRDASLDQCGPLLVAKLLSSARHQLIKV